MNNFIDTNNKITVDSLPKIYEEFTKKENLQSYWEYSGISLESFQKYFASQMILMTGDITKFETDIIDNINKENIKSLNTYYNTPLDKQHQGFYRLMKKFLDFLKSNYSLITKNDVSKHSWVVAYNKNREISSITDNTISFYKLPNEDTQKVCRWTDIGPIPMDVTWIEKLGLVKLNENESVITFEPKPGFDDVTYNKKTNEWMQDNKLIKFVHQIQNYCHCNK